MKGLTVLDNAKQKEQSNSRFRGTLSTIWLKLRTRTETECITWTELDFLWADEATNNHIHAHKQPHSHD